jgi:hypothetical protein
MSPKMQRKTQAPKLKLQRQLIYVDERHTATITASTFELTRVSNDMSRMVNMISRSPAIQVEVIGIEDLHSCGSDSS